MEQNHTLLFIILALTVSFLLLGCSNTQIPAKVDDSGATPKDIVDVTEANNKFAFDLYSKYKSDEGNVFFSPYSISTALAMTYEGARGTTAEEMRSVFYFPEDAEARRAGYARLYNSINAGSKDYKLSTANALWAQKDYPFIEEYFSTIKNYYGGGVTNLDFVTETEKSRVTINKWVEDQTNDKIKYIIPPGTLDSMTRLVLTNAIYFKGEWAVQFEKKNTAEDDFKVSPTNNAKVQMMSLTGKNAKFDYAETEDLQMIELPYEGDELSMIILLPKENDVSVAESYLTAQKMSELYAQKKEKQVRLYLPRFKFDTKYFMAEDLKEIGMPTAFSDFADFSGMTGNNDLQISDVIHQAFVEVNEEGTEAAAATVVTMKLGSSGLSEQIPVFKVDHPFIFMITEKSTGSILFIGRVSNPNG